MTDLPEGVSSLREGLAADAPDPAPVVARAARWDDEWVEEYDPTRSLTATSADDREAPALDVQSLEEQRAAMLAAGPENGEDVDPQVQGLEREAAEVMAEGAVVAAREIARDPDDPEALTEGITASTANWERHAAQVGAAAPRAARSPGALVRVTEIAGSTASLADRVRELHGDQEEAEIVDQGIDGRERTALQRIEQLRGQATDLAYTIDPAPRPGPHLQH